MVVFFSILQSFVTHESNGEYLLHFQEVCQIEPLLLALSTSPALLIIYSILGKVTSMLGRMTFYLLAK